MSDSNPTPPPTPLGSAGSARAPFKRGRTGIKGRTKYIQPETGSWVTLNENGDCHLGAWHRHLGTLLEVAGELEQRKEYAEAWRINMQRAERERDEALSLLPALRSAAEKALEALDDIGRYQGKGGPGTPWQEIVRDCGAAAREAAADLRTALNSQPKTK